MKYSKVYCTTPENCEIRYLIYWVAFVLLNLGIMSFADFYGKWHYHNLEAKKVKESKNKVAYTKHHLLDIYTEYLELSKKGDEEYLTIFNSVFPFSATEIDLEKKGNTIMRLINYKPYFIIIPPEPSKRIIPRGTKKYNLYLNLFKTMEERLNGKRYTHNHGNLIPTSNTIHNEELKYKYNQIINTKLRSRKINTRKNKRIKRLHH